MTGNIIYFQDHSGNKYYKLCIVTVRKCMCNLHNENCVKSPFIKECSLDNVSIPFSFQLLLSQTTDIKVNILGPENLL